MQIRLHLEPEHAKGIVKRAYIGVDAAPEALQNGAEPRAALEHRRARSAQRLPAGTGAGKRHTTRRYKRKSRIVVAAGIVATGAKHHIAGADTR